MTAYEERLARVNKIIAEIEAGSTYEERLATFTSSSTSWPHISPTPQPKDLAANGFTFTPSKRYPDMVQCIDCKLNLDGWEPNDNPVVEHTSRSPDCSFAKNLQETVIQIVPQEPEKPVPQSASDIGFFNPSLQQDFPELRLYHDVEKFINRVKGCQADYCDKDILQLLPKCLRGLAFTWCQSIHEVLKNADLNKHMEVLIAKFKKQPVAQPVTSLSTPKSAPQITPQQPLEYHKCTICSASFSSLSLLLSHNQIAICNKSSCTHCEEAFDSKNKLHEHLRNHECQQSSPNKSIAPHNSSLSALTPAENTAPEVTSKPTSPLPEYRAVSPPPPTYETSTPKTYLTIADLYMRYAPLKSAKSSLTMRILTATMTVQNLYEKFHEKEKPTIFMSNKACVSPANQNAAFDSRKRRFKCSKAAAETPFLPTIKSSDRVSTMQRQDYQTPVKYDTSVSTCIDTVRKHTTSPWTSSSPIKAPAQFRSHGMSRRTPHASTTKII